MYRRAWYSGRRKPIEGAPFAQWGIHAVDSLPGSVLKHTVYPDADRVQGKARTVLGDVLLIPERSIIGLRPRRGCGGGDLSALMDWGKEHRDSGDFGAGLTPETATEEIVLTTLTLSWDVFRCDVEGCDKFGRWHRGCVGWRRLPEPHSAHHMSLSGVYDCELRLGLDGWRPYVDIGFGNNSMSIAEASNLASDLAWILAEAHKLNGAQEVVPV